MKPDGPVLRLTENEKVCLRRKMLPETSKEVARALDISTHAVDKRLKTARLKLGVSTTLDAARILAERENWDQSLVPQKMDLPAPQIQNQFLPGVKEKNRFLLVIGFGGMGVIAGILVLILQMENLAPAQHATTVAEAEQFLARNFQLSDKDGSGFIESGEQPPMKIRRIENGGNRSQQRLADADTWIDAFDNNGDRRVSREEYIARLLPGILEQGIPGGWKRAR
jgi:DNA-binding CsgD family transcriptional regulator